MMLSSFSDKTVVPNDDMLTEVLTTGSKAHWDSIRHYAESFCGTISEQWQYNSLKVGWLLNIKSGRRTLLYLIPTDMYFKAVFMLDESRISAIKKAGLPDHVIAHIMETTPHAEIRTFSVEIKDETDVDTVRKLIEVTSASPQ